MVATLLSGVVAIVFARVKAIPVPANIKLLNDMDFCRHLGCWKAIFMLLFWLFWLTLVLNG